MITPSDTDYQETKRIKLGFTSLSPPFSQLKEWIEEKYSVNVLNIYYDKIAPDDRPRLSIALDRDEDERIFVPKKFTQDRYKSKRIEKEFNQLIKLGNYAIDTQNMFVIFSSFENVARIEANEHVSENELKNVLNQFPNEHLWTIQACFSTVVFFYHTENEKKRAIKAGMRDKFKLIYQKAIQQYDEFGYVKDNPIEPGIDTKENFDSNYQSSWFYYWR